MKLIKGLIKLNILLVALFLVSCQSSNTELALLEGTVSGNTKKMKAYLLKVEHGTTVKVATTSLSEGGKFGFAMDIDQPGLYVLNFSDNEGGYVGLNRFYLEKGTVIRTQFNGGIYELVETNSKKNQLLTKWNQAIDTVYSLSHSNFVSKTYEDFFPILPDFVKMTEEFRRGIDSGDKEFDNLMHMLCELDMNYAALNFVFTPRKKYPKVEDYPEYYDYVMNQRQPDSEEILKSPIGVSYLWNYSMLAMRLDPDKRRGNEYIRASIQSIPNDVLKGYLGLFHLKRRIKFDQSFLFFKELTEPYLLNDYLKSEAKAFEFSIRNNAAGTPAFNFTAKDMDGKTHKLSDYKGKLVYVDVWATWCGPCKKEIPHLETLQEEYKDKDITFMSVSIDKPEKIEQWKKYVNTHNLKGVQLVGENGFGSEVARAFGISSIPRFMLFDENGNIITVKAPRPSDKENVTKLIEESL